jgi:hypothetical protein
LDTMPLPFDVVTGLFLKNPGKMKANAASALDAQGMGDQEAWLTKKAVNVLEQQKPKITGS